MDVAIEIRVRGRVQGVGFRPTVWRIARELGLCGEVLNDFRGRADPRRRSSSAVDGFVVRMTERTAAAGAHRPASKPRALSAICRRISHRREPRRRRAYRGRAGRRDLPGLRAGNCRSVPAALPLSLRQLHALRAASQHRQEHSLRSRQDDDGAVRAVRGLLEPNIAIRPTAASTPKRSRATTAGRGRRLVRLDGGATSFDQHSMLDDVDAACGLSAKGEIVAIKGLGGYQLACDATKAEVVARLRRLKRRERKPFALMARDLEVIRALLRGRTPRRSGCSPAQRRRSCCCAPTGRSNCRTRSRRACRTLGFMLPTTPLHLLVLRRMERPVVMTSGNCLRRAAGHRRRRRRVSRLPASPRTR